MPASTRPPAEPWGDLWQAVRTAVWHRPLVTITVATLAGIAWADRTLPPYAWLGGLQVASAALAILSHRFSRVASRVFVVVLMFLVGAALHVYRLTPGHQDIVQLSGTTVPVATALVLRTGWAADAATACDEARVRVGTWQGLVRLQLPSSHGARLPEPGDCLRLENLALSPTPREPRWLWRERIFALGTAARVTFCGRDPALGARLADQALRLNRRFLDLLVRAMPGSNPRVYAELLSSMVFGQRAAEISGPFKGLFRASGTMHLLVVSGAQVSLIAVTLVCLVRGRRRYLPLWAVPVLFLGLLAFAVLVGAGVSVNRAVVMQGLLLAALALGRSYDLPTALALSALGLCLVDTSALFAVGPQLTYACTLGLYLSYPRSDGEGPSGERGQTFYAAARGTLGAWLFSLPILAAHLGQVILLGALANVIAVPLAAVLLYLGLLAVALGLLWAPLAAPFCFLARGLLEVLLASNAFFAGLPGAVLPVARVPAPIVVLWYAGLFALYLALHRRHLAAGPRRHSWHWPVVALFLIGGLAVLAAGWQRGGDRTWELHLLDVGAGQCLLLRTPQHQWVMIDAGAGYAGPDGAAPARRLVLPYLALHHVRRLEALVLSHAHVDHCGLAAAVLEALPVGQVLLGPDVEAGTEWRAMLDAARARGLTPLPMRPGGALQLGPEGVLECLEPTYQLAGTASDANNNNLVLRLVMGGVSCFLPGDLQAEGEARLLRDYAATPGALRSTMLLAGHHGSRYSNGPAFLRAVRPEVILLSCGRTRAGAVPGAWEEAGAPAVPVWRTDAQGTIVLQTKGGEYWLRGSK